MASSEPQQRITRLTPWREALSALDRLAAPASPRERGVVAAIGCILAEDVRVCGALPPVATAVRDGWAVRADLVADAGPYAPAPLAPAPVWVDSGDPLPSGCDAVLPPDAVVATAAGYEALAPAAPGEGAAPAGFDAAPDAPLAHAGDRLGLTAAAGLRAAGIGAVSVRRPRVGIVSLSAAEAAGDAVAAMVVAALAQVGAEPVPLPPEGDLAGAVKDAAVDALVTIGGTGEGRRDRAAAVVAAAGRLVLHGVGIRPGETAGIGAVAERPMLMLPGRLDAALGAWLLLGRPLLQRLTGAVDDEVAPSRALTRKLTSNIGLAEAVLVERDGDGVRPIAAGAFPLSALTHAAGWVLVPPESEGYASGANVAVRPLP